MAYGSSSHSVYPPTHSAAQCIIIYYVQPVLRTCGTSTSWSSPSQFLVLQYDSSGTGHLWVGWQYRGLHKARQAQVKVTQCPQARHVCTHGVQSATCGVPIQLHALARAAMRVKVMQV